MESSGRSYIVSIYSIDSPILVTSPFYLVNSLLSSVKSHFCLKSCNIHIFHRRNSLNNSQFLTGTLPFLSMFPDFSRFFYGSPPFLLTFLRWRPGGSGAATRRAGAPCAAAGRDASDEATLGWADFMGEVLIGFTPVDRRKFRSQTSDNMDRWKAEQGRGREKRKIRREKIRRERVRRKKMQMREKVGKSRFTVFFQWFVAKEGRKVGSLKRPARERHFRQHGVSNQLKWHIKHGWRI